MKELSSEKYYQQLSSLLLRGEEAAINTFINQHTIVDRFVDPIIGNANNSVDYNDLPAPPKNLNIVYNHGENKQ